MSVESTELRSSAGRGGWAGRNGLVACAVAVYLIYNGIRFMLIKDFSEWDDVFVLAARRLRDGLDIYQLVPQNQNHAYSYPPLQALLATPFTLLPRYVGRFIWYLISAVSLLLMVRWAWIVSDDETGAPGQSKAAPWQCLVIGALGLLCSLRYMQDNLEHQQTDLFIGAIVMGGCLAWRRRHSGLAATCWGLASAMKGPPLLFASYLIWRGRWLAAVWMVALFFAANLLPDLVHRAPQGLWLTHWYATMIRPMSEVGAWHSDVLMNQSLAGAVRRFGDAHVGPGTLKTILYSIEIVLLSLTALAMGRPFRMVGGSRQDSTGMAVALECSMVLALMLLLSPMSSKPHFCVLVLPALCLARLAVIRHDRLATLVVLICIVLVVVLDRNLLGRSLGVFLPWKVDDPALWLGTVMGSAAVLWIGCLVKRRDFKHSTRAAR